MHRVAIVDSHYESVPVLPLPNFVLFPNTMTRIHVSEKNNGSLVADALAQDRLIVLVGLKPGHDEDLYGSRPVYEVGSLCKIVNEERLENNQYNIFVHSVARVRVRTIHRLQPYRTAELEVIPDHTKESDEAVAAMVSRLVGCVRGLILEFGQQGVALGSVLTSTRKADILTNRLATALATDPLQKQELLETVSVHDRAELLTELAGELLLRSSQLLPNHANALIN